MKKNPKLLWIQVPCDIPSPGSPDDYQFKNQNPWHVGAKREIFQQIEEMLRNSGKNSHHNLFVIATECSRSFLITDYYTEKRLELGYACDSREDAFEREKENQLWNDLERFEEKIGFSYEDNERRMIQECCES